MKNPRERKYHRINREDNLLTKRCRLALMEMDIRRRQERLNRSIMLSGMIIKAAEETINIHKERLAIRLVDPTLN